MEFNEINEVEGILKRGRVLASVRRRAHMLKLTHEGMSDTEIAKTVGVTRQSVYHVRKRYVEKGFRLVLDGEKRPGRPSRFDDKDEAELTAIACSQPPEGRARWTLALLSTEMKEKTGKSIKKSRVALMLKKTA
jgi:transposase